MHHKCGFKELVREKNIEIIKLFERGGSEMNKWLQALHGKERKVEIPNFTKKLKYMA